jgi:hypothetical protein
MIFVYVITYVPFQFPVLPCHNVTQFLLLNYDLNTYEFHIHVSLLFVVLEKVEGLLRVISSWPCLHVYQFTILSAVKGNNTDCNSILQLISKIIYILTID